MDIIRIITDDFTSATDGLAAFAQRGWSSAVALSQEAQLSAQVISTDTDSRHLSPAQAQQAVVPWAKTWQHADVLVKQFDSTLRGCVAPEVLAVWQASGKKKLLIAPAFPAAGRTTVAGEVLVQGIPVSQTSFAQDPLSPVTQSDVAALFAQHGQGLVLASNATGAVHALEVADAVLMDATTEQDLQDIVAMAWARRDLLWAGSTGLMRAFAQTLPGQASRHALTSRCIKPLVVMGSHHPRSRLQLAHLQKTGAIDVLATPNQAGNSITLMHELTQQVKQTMHASRCDGLIVTGGETAKHIAAALHATGITVLREVDAGIPLCLLHTPSGDVPLITKAGGFGTDDIFVRCLNILQGGHA
jgi:D-threonate/D-erythronate kinase